MSGSRSRAVVGVGLVALIASVIGLILGLFAVNSVSSFLGQSVLLSESALLAAEQTVDLIESVAAEVDGGLASAAGSIRAAADGVETASGQLEDLAAFLDGDLRASIETLHGAMPAAIQTAGVIDSSLRALSFLGVDYDPDEPFDASLMAMEEVLAGLPSQLGDQAEAIRALVPVSQQFADDAGRLAESFDSLRVELETTQQIVDSYKATIEQARDVIERTGSSLDVSVWLLRVLVMLMALIGSALALGIIMLGRQPAHSTESGFDGDLSG
ncbi:MAG: hypothetical protein ACRDX9_06200 [Acidimicrobiia bacterium]